MATLRGLRLRSHLLSAVRTPSHLPAASSLHHHLLLSTAAASPAPFVVEDFLVTSCGLVPALALRAARRIAYLKSPSKPDAVLAFFADSGLDKAAVAAAIARDPRLLCSKLEKSLKPRLAMLRDIGLSPPQVSSLITIAPDVFLCPTKIPRLAFYLSFLGSYDKVYTALRRSPFLLGHDLQSVVKPNMAFLGQCGLTESDIAKFFCSSPSRMFILGPERLKEIVVCVDKLGVPRCSPMFKYALVAIHQISPRRIDAKMDFLKKALGCSDTELGIALRKLPTILSVSEARLSRGVEFLKMEVGLKAEYIVHRPALCTYSRKRRLIPRHYVLQVLKEKGLMKKDHDFFAVVSVNEEKFVKRYLDPYKESVPGLADAYAAACADAEQAPSLFQPLQHEMEMLNVLLPP